MNADGPEIPRKDPGAPPKGVPVGAVGVVALVAMLAALLLPSEGRKFTPYRDSAGVWTVCLGITGPAVMAHPGQAFTPAECDQLEQRYLGSMVRSMQACTPQPVLNTVSRDEFLAYAHWDFNTGAYCRSSVSRYLRAGDHVRACHAMGAWTWITVRGQHVDCRIAANRCSGLVRRREREVSMCLDALN